MADQAAAIDFPSYLISDIERGEADFPENYLTRLIEWLQLDEDETLELRLLAHKKHKGRKGQRLKGDISSGQSLATILTRPPAKGTPDTGSTDAKS